MFSLFNKQSGSIRIVDKITLSQNARWEHCLQEWKENKNVIFIAWFNDTADAFKTFISANSPAQPEICLANEMQFVHTENRPVIFIEHFPLFSKEQALFQRLHLKEAVVYSSLDDPFFIRAGSEKLRELMQSLGMKENEILQHNMISASIKQMQKKVEAKITIEQSARSQLQWMDANVP